MSSQKEIQQFDKELVADPSKRVSHGVSELMAMMASMPYANR